MELISTVTSKGQTTVPRKVREALGIGPRQRIIYEIDGGTVRMRAAGGSLLASAGVLADAKAPLSRGEERATYRKARASATQSQHETFAAGCKRFTNHNVDFLDAYLAAQASASDVPVSTFDKDFRKFKDVVAVSP